MSGFPYEKLMDGMKETNLSVFHSPSGSKSSERICDSSAVPRRKSCNTSLTVQQNSKFRSYSDTDRFIPNRSTSDFEFASHVIAQKPDLTNGTSAFLWDTKTSESERKILSFKSKALNTTKSDAVPSEVFDSHVSSQSTKFRQVLRTAITVIDAPNITGNFGLKVIDWSDSYHMAVILSSCVALLNAKTNEVHNLSKHPLNLEYSCVSWIEDFLAVGDNVGVIGIWDGVRKKRIRYLQGHAGRVGAMAWNTHILASGSQSGIAHLHDVRIKNHIVNTLSKHSRELRSLDFNLDGNMLATGGGDGKVYIWDMRELASPLWSLKQHKPAVNTVKWCPWSKLTLATGGGEVDRTLKIWNALNGNCVRSVDTKSQIGSVIWNSEYKELACSHGFYGNELTVWDYPSFSKIAILRGHSSKIINLAASVDGSVVASAAEDETIRFWQVWPLKGGRTNTAQSRSATELFQKIR